LTTNASQWNQGMLTKMERLQLAYLSRAGRPLWGGHLQRAEPITCHDMKRWVELGLIEAYGNEGYILTERGRKISTGEQQNEPLGDS
jgi:hypothetical protein